MCRWGRARNGAVLIPLVPSRLLTHRYRGGEEEGLIPKYREALLEVRRGIGVSTGVGKPEEKGGRTFIHVPHTPYSSSPLSSSHCSMNFLPTLWF